MAGVTNHTYANNDRTVTGRQFGVGNGARTVWNLAGMDSDRALLHPVLYKIDWGGIQQLYNTARTNLCLQSQTFGTTWDVASYPCSVAANTTVAPDGSTTADTITATAGNARHGVQSGAITAAAGSVHTCSVYVKKGNYTNIVIGDSNDSVWHVSNFDLDAGTNIGDTNATGTIVPVAGSPGWYRVTTTFTRTVTGSMLFVIALQNTSNKTQVTGFNAAGTETLIVWGADVKAGSTLSSYIPTTTAAVTVTDYSTDSAGKVTFASAPAIGTQLTYKDPWATNAYRHFGLGDGSATMFSLPYAPRDPFVLANGVLQGNGTATNLAIRSQDFSAGWSLVNAPTRVSAALTYSGLTLDLIGDDSAVLVKGFYQAITLTGDGIKSLSFYISKGTATTTMVRLQDATAAQNRILASITWSGVVPSVSMLNGTLVGVESIGNGIYRVLTTGTGFVAANTHNLFVYPATSTAGFLSADTGDVLLGGFQVENSPQPSPYIPTTTVAKTGDYTAAPNGDVTFVSAPADTAALTWTGNMGVQR